MHIRYVLALSLLLVAVTACRRDAEPVPDVETPPPSSQPTVGESPLSPPATPSPVQPEQGHSPLPLPETSPLATPDDPVVRVVDVAREYLAGQLDVPIQEVQPVLAEAVEWSDASLGCPESGKAYAQVITPGYRIVLSVGDREYELHTDRSARNIVICDRL